nr:hypothetical protein [Tanacetum cinerariifolium]
MRTRSRSRHKIAEPLRIEFHSQEDQFQEDPPEVLMANNRTMTQLLQAPTVRYEDAIVIPEIAATNFELKHGLINLVQNKQFFGHDKEDPHAHIRYFNKITSTMRVPNVPNSTIKLMLFPFSLKGAARIWLEKEPPRSILTWDDLVSKFINQFFPPSKTTNLRNEITRFQERFNESFSEAWGRFNDLLRACPHHGFFELHQLDQNSLNSAAGGNFLDKMPSNFWKIIKSNQKFDNHDPRQSLPRALLLDMKNQSSASATSPTPALVEAVESNCVTCGGTHSYQNCPVTSGNVYQDNIHEGNNFTQNRGGNFNQSNFNQSQLHRSQVNQAPAYQTPIPQTQSVSQTDFERYVKANDAVLRNIQSQGQSTQNQCQNIQNQYQTVQNQLANLTDIMSKFMNSNMASSSGSGTLPGNRVTNPKEDLNGITTRSDVAYKGPTIPTPSKVVKQGTEANEQIEKFYEIFKDISFEISFTKALILMPKFASILKALIGNKEKLSEMARTLMNEHCLTVILNKFPKKLRDPGKFLTPCEFPKMDECLALADLGASINLMPLSMWKELALPELTPTYMTLELTNCSVSKPIGIAKDVSVKVGMFYFPAEFMVVDFEPDPRVPLILGSPTSSDDPIVSTTSPTLTPFGDSDFLLFEEANAFLDLEDDPDSPELDPSYYDPEGDI